MTDEFDQPLIGVVDDRVIGEVRCFYCNFVVMTSCLFVCLAQISENIGRPWLPLDCAEIPRAVFDLKADCEAAYIDALLSDHQ